MAMTLCTPQRAQYMSKMIDKLDFIKTENMKDIKRMRRQTTG